MADLPPIVLVFAATDPSGGAGLQSDIMTLSSMGCHPLSVVTAITVTVLGPYVNVVIVLLYLDARGRKEGLTLPSLAGEVDPGG